MPSRNLAPLEPRAAETSGPRLLRRLRSPLAIALTLFAGACASDKDAGSTQTAKAPPPPAPSAVAPAVSTPPPAPSAEPSAVASADAGAPPAAGGMPPDLNVLMISIDSMRADMPWAGYPRDIAPAMTAFEKTAVSYTRAYSVSSYTAMSLGGFLSGRYPSEIARSGYFFSAYPESVLFFPELLQKAGVRTMAGHAHFYFDQKSGFRQGFDVYKLVPGLSQDNTTDKNITSPEHLALAEEMLSDKANTSKRFFAWFHFMDPHDEYLPHEGIGPYGKSGRDRYDGEITFVDQHIGKLLQFVDQQEWGKRTAIVITADHGEAFGEHKMYRHGFEIYEMLVHIPLMIRAPGITPHHVDVPRSTIDLAPTFLEMTGAPPEPTFQGKSLVAELYGAAPEVRDVIVDLPRTGDNDRRRALVKGDYKLIAFGDDEAYELYDIVHDPQEKHDVKRAADKKAIFEEMKAAYKARNATIIDVCPKMTEKLKGKNKHRKC